MCMHVNDTYSFHHPGKPNPEHEGQSRKKENSNTETITSRKHRNSTPQAGWEGRRRAGREGHGSAPMPTCDCKWGYSKSLG